MALRKFNPITPGMRHKVLSKFEEITTDKPHKPLLEPIKKSGVTVLARDQVLMTDFFPEACIASTRCASL